MPVGVACPGCGSGDISTVEQARTAKRARRDDLLTRLETQPAAGDGCLHAAEGLVIAAGVGGGLAYKGVNDGAPLYIAGGVLLALVIIVITGYVVRDDGREKEAVAAGAERAEQLSRQAHYCYGCSSVFCVDGVPWRGLLTPDQFKKLVWTEAGYADKLTAGDKALKAEVPPGVLPEPGRG